MQANHLCLLCEAHEEQRQATWPIPIPKLGKVGGIPVCLGGQGSARASPEKKSMAFLQAAQQRLASMCAFLFKHPKKRSLTKMRCCFFLCVSFESPSELAKPPARLGRNGSYGAARGLAQVLNGWLRKPVRHSETVVEAIVGWYIQRNEQKPGFLRWCEMTFVSFEGDPQAESDLGPLQKVNCCWQGKMKGKQCPLYQRGRQFPSTGAWWVPSYPQNRRGTL